MPTQLAIDDSGNPIQALALGAAQDVAIGASSVQSTAFATDTKVILLAATAACRIATGANPTAISTGVLLPANAVMTLKVKGGHKVAVIQESTSGKLSVTQLT